MFDAPVPIHPFAFRPHSHDLGKINYHYTTFINVAIMQILLNKLSLSPTYQLKPPSIKLPLCRCCDHRLCAAQSESSLAAAGQGQSPVATGFLPHGGASHHSRGGQGVCPLYVRFNRQGLHNTYWVSVCYRKVSWLGLFWSV